MSDPVSHEFSRPLSILEIPSKGVRQRLEASTEECEALAARIGVVAVLQLSAMLEVKPWRSTGLSVSGTFEARVEQACVVTLEPVVSDVSEDILVYFLPDKPRKGRSRDAEILVDPLDENEPEPLSGSTIDLGDLVVEHAILAIDPYPKAPGADASMAAASDTAEDDPGPFAALAALRRDGGDG